MTHADGSASALLFRSPFDRLYGALTGGGGSDVA
jgi:hypothetical protein